MPNLVNSYVNSRPNKRRVFISNSDEKCTSGRVARLAGKEEHSSRQVPSARTNRNSRYSHSVPWDSLTRFVSPFVIRVDSDRYVCVLCNCSIPNETGFLEVHTAGLRHSCAMDDYGFNITPRDNGRFYCLLCDRVLDGYSAIPPHVRREEHQRARRDDDRARLSRPSSWESFACPFVKKIDSRLFYCMICDYEAPSRDEFLSHAGSEDHASAVLRDEPHLRPLEDDFFHCGLCNVVLPRADTVRPHLSGRRHRHALQTDWAAQPSFVSPFVRRRTETGYHCLLCNQTVEGSDAALKQHRAKEFHVWAEQRDEEHLLPLHGGRYSCVLCRYVLCDWRRIHSHLCGAQHQRALTKAQPEISGKPKASRPSGSFVGNGRNQPDEKSSPQDERFGEEYRLDEGAVTPSDTRNLCGDLCSNGKQRASGRRRSFVAQSKLSSAAKVLGEFDESVLDFVTNRRSSYCDEGERPLEIEERSRDIQESQDEAKERRARSEEILESQGRPNKIWERPKGKLNQIRKEAKEIDEKTNQTWEKPLEFQERSEGLQEWPKELQEKPKEVQESPKELQERPEELQERPEELQEQPEDLQEKTKELPERPKEIHQECWRLSASTRENHQCTSSTLHDEMESAQPLDLPTILSLMNEELATLSEELRLQDTLKIENDHCESEAKRKSTSQLPCGRSPSSRIENLQTLTRFLSSRTISSTHSNEAVDSSAHRPKEIEFVGSNNEDLSPRTSTMSASFDENSARRPRNAYLDKVFTLLNFDEDIYDTRETTRTTLLSFNLRISMNSSTDYCLVCHKTVANDFEKLLAHSCDREHLKCMRNMEKEELEIRGIPDTLGELSLAHEYVEGVSRDAARCLVCRVTLGGDYCALARHIDDRKHCAARDRMRARTKENLELVASRLQCDWYKVQKYECLVCSIKFDTEIDFVEHLIESAEHTRKFSTNGETKVYAFCAVCALIYCVRATARTNHHETLAHKWFVRNGPFVIDRLPVAAELLLSSLEDYEDFEMAGLMEEIENSCRSSIINAHGRGTGYDLHSNFSVEAPLENVKFIRFFDKIFPPGAKILSFLKLWLTGCDLSGIQGISSVALYWYFVLYLQTLSILPSVASLSSMKAFWHSLADWEDISTLETKSPTDLRHHLVGFFALYANFDYRYDVACPLLGKVIEKRAFADDVRYLPEEMRSYVTYMTCYEYPEPFRIDASMCLQDPLDLPNNLTKSVTKVDLSRFRIFCSKSLSVLFPPDM